jgi:hypothetical protein
MVIFARAAPDASARTASDAPTRESDFAIMGFLRFWNV